MPAPQRIVIVGAGGQARDTAWLLSELSTSGAGFELAGFLVSDLSKLSERDSRHQVLGDFSWLERHATSIDGLVLGIGNPQVRVALATELAAAYPRLIWPSLVHPSAIYDRASAKLGRGVMVAAGVTGSVNLELDDFALVNIAVTLGHEARIGSGSVVNHGASISGGVHVGREVLVGTGARILQYLSVGDRARVGAGAVVTRDVAGGVTVVGVPARDRSLKLVS
jgi:sugar O-acyltransferase (sialic acid O-acetyltransferase NeuD family)